MKKSLNSEKSTQNRYSAEFQKQACAMAKKIGVTETCKALGIKSHSSLHTWIRKEKGEMVSDSCELQALKQKVKDLSQQLAKSQDKLAKSEEKQRFLREAVAFFCQEQGGTK